MSIDFNRTVAKAICANNIAADVCYWIAHFAASEDAGEPTEPSEEMIEEYAVVAPMVAEAVIKHLDAYDQRG